MSDGVPVPKQRHWPNGQVKEEWTEVNGRKEGWRRFYLETGFMFSEMEFRNGVGNGVIRDWHAPGVRRMESTLKNGEFHGTYTRWYPSGRVMEQGVYDNGRQTKGYSYYTEDGRVWKVVKGTDGDMSPKTGADSP